MTEPSSVRTGTTLDSVRTELNYWIPVNTGELVGVRKKPLNDNKSSVMTMDFLEVIDFWR